MTQRPRATLKQIAKFCGVSHTTVSMVINNSPRISPETRDKVLAAIKKFNYHPNAAARSLVMSRTNTIGLVGTMFASPYYNEIVHGIEMECRHLGLDIKIYNAEQTGADYKEAYDKIFGERSCDVIIAISMPLTEQVVERFKGEEMPLVVLQPVLVAGRQFEDVPTVFIDDRKGMAKAVSYLIQLGHRKIGLLNGRRLYRHLQPARPLRVRGRLRDRQRALRQAPRRHGGLLRLRPHGPGGHQVLPPEGQAPSGRHLGGGLRRHLHRPSHRPGVDHPAPAVVRDGEARGPDGPCHPQQPPPRPGP
jgi:DNA-binding LacI/PurR family transcriptional regulator